MSAIRDSEDTLWDEIRPLVEESFGTALDAHWTGWLEETLRRSVWTKCERPGLDPPIEDKETSA